MWSIKAQLPGLYSCVQFHSTAEHADLDISNITMLQWYNVYNVTIQCYITDYLLSMLIHSDQHPKENLIFISAESALLMDGHWTRNDKQMYSS